MSCYDTEVASQPDCWREAGRLAVVEAGALPRDGQRVAAVGCGTSLYVAQAYAAWRESAGLGETDAFAASQWPSGRRYDAVLVITRSGTTTEVLRCLSSLPSGTRRHAVTAVAGGPIDRLVDELIQMPFADEQSVVQTRFATSTLALLRSALGQDIEPISAAAELALADPLVADPSRFEQFVFLGESAGAALAQEAALKIREGTGSWTEAYPVMEYRHGPISAATDRSLVWAIGPVDPAIADDLSRTVATFINDSRDPMVELVCVHQFTSRLAEFKRRNIDSPPFLSRSVVLA